MVDHESPQGPPALRSSDPALADLIDARLTLQIHDADHLVELMNRVAELAVDHIAGADHAGMTVVLEGSDPFTIAPTDKRVKEFDRSQYDLDAGPCLLATRSDHVVEIDLPDMISRWPDLAAVSQECGISRVLAAPIHRHNEAVGSLNLYTDIDTAVIISSTSAVLAVLLVHLDRAMNDYCDNLAAARQVQVLRSALEDRTIIDNALGIITETRRCSHDEAVEILDAAARAENTGLRSIASRIVADRAL